MSSTVLVERMAQRRAEAGAPHPIAGALAAAVRGRHQLDRAMFAAELRIDIGVVEAAEAGRTALADLPAPIAERIGWLGVDLAALDIRMSG